MTKLYKPSVINGSATNLITNLTQKDVRKSFNWITKFLMLIHLMFVLGSLVNNSVAQTYSPRNYWTFNSSTFNRDSMSNFNLDFTSYGCGYSVANSSVAKGLLLSPSNSNNINAGNLIVDSAFAIEFLIKPGPKFHLTTFFRRLDGAIGGYISNEGWVFYTNTTGTGVDYLKVPFDGIGKKSYGYLIDGNWHHIVFQYSKNKGLKQIFIDGECPSGFSKSVSGNVAASSNTTMFINQGVTYERFDGQYDEIAFYNVTLPQTLIYKHYQEALQGKAYSFTNNTTTVPPVSAITGPLDMTEFAPGHPNVNVPALEQLKSFPLPRYKPGNTLLKNFNWIDLAYMGGRFQTGVSDATAITTSTSMNEEMAKNFNYMIMGKSNGDAFGTAWTALANANPQLELGIITLRAQLNPCNIRSQSLAAANYLQNSSGQTIDPSGNASSFKYWRPTAAPTTYEGDGNQVKSNLQWYLTTLTRPLNMINENGEVFNWGSDNALAADPAVAAAKAASGLDYQTFQGRKFMENETQSYRDKFMTLPGLANTKFTEYAVDGFPQYRMKYSEARKVNSMIKGQYYSTPDFYPRWPNNWRNWMGAWHGWQWIVDSRYHELAVGDKLFSPFVAAGWDVIEENNIRPAQWLGLLKMLNILGAEFFYAGFFNEQGNYGPGLPLPADPKNYVWQAVMPSYAQAVTSRFEDLLRNGNLMNGDFPAYYVGGSSAPGYSFWTGDLRQLVSARKHQSLAKYVIAGTIQPNTSMIGDAPNETTAQINLDGNNLKFKVRRQGSTYVYDRTNAAAPIFYQLDEWHEKTHPSYWTKDFTVEAELFDNSNATYSLKTTVPAGTAAGDYTNYTTAITYAAGTTSFTPIEYVFRPRTSSNQTYYLWVRARSKSGTSTGVTVSLDNGAAKTISCITDTVWNWYRYDACNMQPVSFTGVTTTGDHTIRFTPANAEVEFDKFMLTTNVALILNPAAPTCGSGGTATISASGPTSLCNGGSVVLTASAGSSYLWSNGATTQSITVNTTGSYSVTVNQTGGCSGASSPVAVTVNSIAIPTITASGSTSLCNGGSVTLSAPTGYSYLWTPGNSTSQIITVNTAGSYTVRVTNAQGCTATSAATVVTVNSGTQASISASGPVTFCQGGNVTLTASNGSAYLWSTGATTQNINVTQQGNYAVTVTNGTCQSTSLPVIVVVNTLPTSTITAGGATTFCQGGSVALTASTGSAYLWSNGATTQSINATVSGSYNVTVTGSNGCKATSASTTVTVNNAPAATITPSGSTTICPGSSVTLTASAGAAYLWSNGATTSSINVNTAGSYTVRVTNSNGCSAISAAVNVTVLSAGNASITASGPTAICAGGSVVLTASTGTSYLWSNGATTQSITATQAGNYSVTVNNGSCSATSLPVAVTITTSPTATITASGSTTICTGGSVTLTASTGTSYLWSNGATTKSITATQAGNYSVTVNNGTCSATSAPVAVTVSANPTATITANGPLTFCPGGSVTLTASAGAAYLWSNGATTQSINVTAAGNYTVKVTNAAGCFATSAATAVTVSNSGTASVTASGATTFCQGGSVTLTASNGTSYLWSNGATTKTITVTQGGSYSVTVNNGSCSATSSAVSVTVNSIPTATITASGATTFVQGGSVTLTANAASSYLWSTGATTQSITVTTSGTYNVKVFSGAGCSATSLNTIVTVNPVGVAASITTSSGANGICPGSTLTLTANQGTAYVWTPGLQTTQSINVTAAGTYSVTVVDVYGNRSTVSITVVAAPSPGKPQVSYAFVPGTAYQLTAFEPSAKSYVWNTGSQLATITVPVIGNYTVKAVNNYGCVGDITTTTVASLNTASCSKPDMLTAYNILDRQATIAWNPAIAADSFKVAYNKVGSTYTAVKHVKNASSVLATELTANTTYEVKVSAMCGSNVNTSAIYKFTTIGSTTPCGYTPLSTITTNINNVSAWLNWFGTTSTSVKIRYKVTGSATYSYQTIQTNGTSYGYKLTGLQSRTTYVWSVMTDCGGVQSQYSPEIAFTTLDDCADVTNVRVLNVTATSADIKWAATSAMQNVRIRYKPVASSDYKTVTVNASLGTKIIKNLIPGTLYEFSVRSICGNGANSPFGASQQFTTPILRLAENDNGLQLNAYPNPAKDQITFAFSSDDDKSYTFKVADMSGRILVQEDREAYAGGNTGTINLSNYATGIYMLIVKKGGLESHLRFSVHK
jgi:hypothetical protein